MSSLVKSVGTIGGLTLLSRIFGFARDMLLARVLGAGLAADAFQLAFTLPNTFRRLFAEGAFSVAFVPMYSRALHGSEGDGEAAAARFADDVLSVFLWTLLVFSGVMMAVMPGIVWILARDFGSVPGKFELAVFLSRLTFPYLALISLVAMLSGLLNARSRFAPGAFAPVLLNIVLIGGIITGWWLRGDSHDDRIVAIALAVAVSLAGVAQLAYLWWAVRRAGLRLHLRLPRLTPEVRRLGMLILPATFGAGIYQISQFVDTFFATSLPQGSLTLLKLADRLNQLPLGIVGIALGTAILPMLSRHIHSGDAAEAQRLQSNAFEMATLLTLPAAAALAICAPAFVTAFFVGGKFTAADGAIMAHIVVALVAGLPAYVIVKILNPGFFAREDAGVDRARRAHPQYCDQPLCRRTLWHRRARRGDRSVGKLQLPAALCRAPPPRLVPFHRPAGEPDRAADRRGRSDVGAARLADARRRPLLWRQCRRTGRRARRARAGGRRDLFRRGFPCRCA
jgi:putative peptidoglycan lipid II flippase